MASALSSRRKTTKVTPSNTATRELVTRISLSVSWSLRLLSILGYSRTPHSRISPCLCALESKIASRNIISNHTVQELSPLLSDGLDQSRTGQKRPFRIFHQVCQTLKRLHCSFVQRFSLASSNCRRIQHASKDTTILLTTTKDIRIFLLASLFHVKQILSFRSSFWWEGRDSTGLRKESGGAGLFQIGGLFRLCLSRSGSDAYSGHLRANSTNAPFLIWSDAYISSMNTMHAQACHNKNPLKILNFSAFFQTKFI